jgi:hypothetical protein
VALILGAGVLVVAVHRGPFGAVDGWVTLALALAVALAMWFLARTRPGLVPPDPVVLPDPVDSTAAAPV